MFKALQSGSYCVVPFSFITTASSLERSWFHVYVTKFPDLLYPKLSAQFILHRSKYFPEHFVAKRLKFI